MRENQAFRSCRAKNPSKLLRGEPAFRNSYSRYLCRRSCHAFTYGMFFPCRPNRMRELLSRILRVVRYLSAGRAASIRLRPGFRNRMSLAVSQAQSCGSPLSAMYERAGSIKKFTSATICGRGESYLTTSRHSGFPVRRPGVHSVPMEVVNRTPARSRPPTSCCPCRPRSSRPSAKPSRRRSDAWVRRSWRYRRGRSRTPASRRYSLRG